MYIFTFTFCRLADAFIQSNLKARQDVWLLLLAGSDFCVCYIVFCIYTLAYSL